MRKKQLRSSYRCHDCDMGFMLFAASKRKKFFCPYCGESAAVHPYTKTNPKEPREIFWTDDRLAQIVEKLNAGALMKEVAADLSTKERKISTEAVKKAYRRATGIGIHEGRRRAEDEQR